MPSDRRFACRGLQIKRFSPRLAPAIGQAPRVGSGKPRSEVILAPVASFSSVPDRPALPLSFCLARTAVTYMPMALAVGDCGEDSPDHWACDGDLDQLESDGTSVTHNAGPNFDQLEAGERPISHLFGQFDAAQEGGRVVGQREQSQPPFVVAEPPA